MNMEFLFALSEEKVIEAAKNRGRYESDNFAPSFDENQCYLVFVKNYFLTADYRHHCLEVVVMDESTEKDALLVYNNDGEEFEEFDTLYTEVTGYKDDNFGSVIGSLFVASIKADFNHVGVMVVASCGNLLEGNTII